MDSEKRRELENDLTKQMNDLILEESNKNKNNPTYIPFSIAYGLNEKLKEVLMKYGILQDFENFNAIVDQKVIDVESLMDILHKVSKEAEDKLALKGSFYISNFGNQKVSVEYNPNEKVPLIVIKGAGHTVSSTSTTPRMTVTTTKPVQSKPSHLFILLKEYEDLMEKARGAKKQAYIYEIQGGTKAAEKMNGAVRTLLAEIERIYLRIQTVCSLKSDAERSIPRQSSLSKFFRGDKPLTASDVNNILNSSEEVQHIKKLLNSNDLSDRKLGGRILGTMFEHELTFNLDDRANDNLDYIIRNIPAASREHMGPEIQARMPSVSVIVDRTNEQNIDGSVRGGSRQN